MFELDPFNDWREEMYGIARLDPWRWECAGELARQEPAFNALMELLTEEQQEVVWDYIVASTEFTFSLIYSAYEVGKRHGQQAAQGEPGR